MSTVVSNLMTAREFARECADRSFCELERGEVVDLTVGGWDHSAICANVAWILGQWARKNRCGRVLAGEAGIVTKRRPDTVRGADVAYASYRRIPRGKGPTGFMRVAPELVVEVVGKGQGWSKMVEKAAEYLEFGSVRVWIIDPRKRTLHVFSPDAEPCRLTARDTIEDEQVLPGFACRVAEFFED